MKTTVETMFVGKGRLYSRRIMPMCSHYLVDLAACTPVSGWEILAYVHERWRSNRSFYR